MTSTAVLVGTRKGLFVARSDSRRHRWTLEGPHLAGYEIQAAFLDPRCPGRGYAAAHHPVWGIHVHRTEDAGHTWQALAEVPRLGNDDSPDALRMIWCLAPGAAESPHTLYAGIEPTGLFVSHDAGESWRTLPGFNRHPTRERWSPAKGGLALHSVQVDPDEPHRLYAALSAGGVFRSDDAGERWHACNRGVRAPYLPERNPVAGHCVHRLLVHPAGGGRLFQQSHNGTYVSDDHGDHWEEITGALPSDFGYALATDPRDPDRLYTVPEEDSQMRATVDGRLRVFTTDDAGRHWRALQSGLPQENVFVTVRRDGLDSDGLAPLGLYMGTSSGHLFASRDAGTDWHLIAGFLPGILTVRAAALESPA